MGELRSLRQTSAIRRGANAEVTRTKYEVARIERVVQYGVEECLKLLFGIAHSLTNAIQ